MKLKNLKIHNFVGVKDADIAFKRPVSLFAGRNNQGKSSIKDAILFALTGKARALTKFKDVKLLSHGNNSLAVDLDYETNDGTEINVHRTPSSVSMGIDERAVLRYCLNPAEFIDLPAKERARVLAEVLGGGMDELVKTAIQEHIGDVDQTVLAELRGSGVSLLDLDAFRKQIIEQRRQYKRDIGQLPDKPPLLGDYELDQDYDVIKDRSAIMSLGGRIAKGADLIAEARKMVETQLEITQLTGKIKKLEGGRQEVPSLPAPVSKDKLNMAPIYMSILETVFRDASTPECRCPVCQKVSNADELHKLHDEIAAWYAKYQGKLDECAAAIESNERIEREIATKTSRLETLKANLKEVDLPASSEKWLEELMQQRDEAQKRINSFERFERDMVTFKECGKHRGSLITLVAECDRIDEALKDGGSVRSAIAAGGRTLPINENLLEAWSIPTLSWSDTGEITLIPERASERVEIEWASKSERQRAACVMGLALAGVSGVGIAAIDDEFESLDEDNRNALFSAVTACGLKNVLVFVSTNKKLDSHADWLEVYHVNQGKISKRYEIDRDKLSS